MLFAPCEDIHSVHQVASITGKQDIINISLSSLSRNYHLPDVRKMILQASADRKIHQSDFQSLVICRKCCNFIHLYNVKGIEQQQ